MLNEKSKRRSPSGMTTKKQEQEQQQRQRRAARTARSAIEADAPLAPFFWCCGKGKWQPLRLPFLLLR
jgi:hypothetical protein